VLTCNAVATIRCTSQVSGPDSVAGLLTPLYFSTSPPALSHTTSTCVPLFMIRCDRHGHERLSSDHDPLYRFHQWQANLRILDVKEIKTVPYVPLSHPFVERLIGTIRREYLDQTLFWTAADLEEKLGAFQQYFNRHRTHSGLEGRLPDPPNTQATLNFASYRWQQHCRGLYQTPIAA